MKKRRKIQILSIVALVIAIAGMSLGFAAFSATLNISSTATVSPSSNDFKLKIYGFESVENGETFCENYSNNGIFLEELLSQTKSVGVVSTEAAKEWVTVEDAVIDNSSLSIKNMNVSFFKPSNSFAEYVFVIRNEGEHTAYLDYEKFVEMYYNGFVDCQILGDSYSDDTATASDYLIFNYMILDQANQIREIEDFSLFPNESVILAYMWKYNGPYVDVPVSCSINNVQFTFTSVPNEES